MILPISDNSLSDELAISFPVSVVSLVHARCFLIIFKLHEFSELIDFLITDLITNVVLDSLNHTSLILLHVFVPKHQYVRIANIFILTLHHCKISWSTTITESCGV